MGTSPRQDRVKFWASIACGVKTDVAAMQAACPNRSVTAGFVTLAV